MVLIGFLLCVSGKKKRRGISETYGAEEIATVVNIVLASIAVWSSASDRSVKDRADRSMCVSLRSLRRADDGRCMQMLLVCQRGSGDSSTSGIDDEKEGRDRVHGG